MLIFLLIVQTICNICLLIRLLYNQQEYDAIEKLLMEKNIEKEKGE